MRDEPLFSERTARLLLMLHGIFYIVLWASALYYLLIVESSQSTFGNYIVTNTIQRSVIAFVWLSLLIVHIVHYFVRVRNNPARVDEAGSRSAYRDGYQDGYSDAVERLDRDDRLLDDDGELVEEALEKRKY